MQRSAEQRFDEIYRKHAGAVTAYARRRAPASTVDDVVADTFAVCWRKLDRVPEDALPWLYAVARKTLANQRRKARPEVPLAELPAEPAVERDPTLGLALAALSERDREVLRLVAWEGLSLAEAAVVLGCTTVACRVRFHRAKRRLRARLDELEAAAARPRLDPEGATR
jgi:RNA polymerase sigma-70 factor (ECF subfamily)